MPDYLRSPTCWALFIGSLAATAALTPVAIRLAHRMGALNREGYRKVSQEQTPLLGGLAIALPFVLVCLLAISGWTGMFRTLELQRWDLAALAIGCVGIVGVGMIDDTRGLRARYKLLVQIIIALFICTSACSIHSLSLPLLGRIELGWFLGGGLTLLWIVGLTNALNIMDGVDGLSAGVSLIACLGLGIIAGLNGQTFVVLLCLALSGSLLAFLAFNFHPAKIFLGDTGSMFLGFTLATISLMGSSKTTGVVMLLTPMLALGLPIFETLVSMARRYFHGRPIFAADSRHTHHRLLNKGFTQRQVAVMLYAATACCVFAAVLHASLSADSWTSYLPVALYAVIVLSIGLFAGYWQPLDKLLAKRRRNSVYAAFSRYAALKLNQNGGARATEEIKEVCRRQLCLRFLEFWSEHPAIKLKATGDGAGGNGDQAPDDNAAQALYESIKQFKVKTAKGQEVFVKYQHGNGADEQQDQAVAACLENIFDRVNVELPPLNNLAFLAEPPAARDAAPEFSYQSGFRSAGEIAPEAPQLAK